MKTTNEFTWYVTGALAMVGALTFWELNLRVVAGTCFYVAIYFGGAGLIAYAKKEEK